MSEEEQKTETTVPVEASGEHASGEEPAKEEESTATFEPVVSDSSVRCALACCRAVIVRVLPQEAVF
jgi:hypothetical protein